MPAGEGKSDETVEVWDDHWDSFAVFRACASQWRVAGTAFVLVHLGLDYPGVEALMRNLLPDSSDRRRIFSDVLVMEAEVLPILNEVAA